MKPLCDRCEPKTTDWSPPGCPPTLPLLHPLLSTAWGSPGQHTPPQAPQKAVMRGPTHTSSSKKGRALCLTNFVPTLHKRVFFSLKPDPGWDKHDSGELVCGAVLGKSFQQPWAAWMDKDSTQWYWRCMPRAVWERWALFQVAVSQRIAPEVPETGT